MAVVVVVTHPMAMAKAATVQGTVVRVINFFICFVLSVLLVPGKI